MVIWHTNPRSCLHENDHVCPTCDFDGYYANAYPGCPWIDEFEDAIGLVKLEHDSLDCDD